MNRTLTLLALTLFCGCSATEVVRPEQLKPDAWQNIAILTRDGRTIRMLAGDYKVVNSSDSTVVRGIGREVVSISPYETKPFSGVIPFSEIEAVETTERSFLTRTLPMMIAFVGIFYLYVGLGFHSPG